MRKIAVFCLKSPPYVPTERADNRENVRGFVWEFVCEGYPLKEQMTGKMRGILVGTSTAKDTPEREKMTGACAGRRLGKVGGKVAEIEFFQIECHAENGHLSADKWTKIVDKVFDLKKTITE